MASLAEQFAMMRMAPSSRTTMEGTVSKGLDSVETGELEKQLTGEAVAGAEKTVVLWLKVHGMQMQRGDRLNESEKSIIYSRPANICPVLEKNPLLVMQTFDRAREQANIDDVIDLMQKISPYEMSKSKLLAVPLIQAASSFQSSESTVEGKMQAYRNAPDEYEIRKPMFDHLLQADREDPSKYASGIFILATNFNQGELLSPVENLAEHLMTDTAAKELQSYNLLNLPVLEELSRRVEGASFVLDDDKIIVIDGVLGIPQYYQSKLSLYVKFFKKLGAANVIVIDDTCQVGSFKQVQGIERAEAADDVNPKKTGRVHSPTKWRNPNDPTASVSDYGGTIKRKKSRRRKSKRNRSRRFHKK